MKIYHYSEKTGEYLGESVAPLDPIEKKPLIPARATNEAPPATGENQAAVWIDDAWQIVDDFRGFVGYDETGEKHEIKELNQKPDPNWTAEPPELPPAPITVVTMRQARLALLGAGLLDQVNGAIEALPEPDRTAAAIEWEYAGVVERDGPITQTLAGALGLTEQQLNDLFTTAATL